MATTTKVRWRLTKVEGYDNLEDDYFDKPFNKLFTKKSLITSFLQKQGYYDLTKSKRLGKPYVEGSVLITKSQLSDGWREDVIAYYQREEVAVKAKRVTKAHSNINWQLPRARRGSYYKHDYLEDKIMVRAALKYAIARMSSMRTYNSLHFRIIYGKLLSENKNTLGTATGSYSTKTQKIHVIHIKTGADLFAQQHVVMHEAVHVMQFLRGKLQHIEGHEVSWDGEYFGKFENISTDNVRKIQTKNGIVTYMNFPWEIEARELADKFYKEFYNLSRDERAAWSNK